LLFGIDHVLRGVSSLFSWPTLVVFVVVSFVLGTVAISDSTRA